MSAISLQNLLSSGDSNGLSKLVKKARNMGELTHILQSALDTDLASSLVAANVRNSGELVVICESPAWAARLRYEADALMQAAREAGLAVSSCRVCVSQSAYDAQSTPEPNAD